MMNKHPIDTIKDEELCTLKQCWQDIVDVAHHNLGHMWDDGDDWAILYADKRITELEAQISAFNEVMPEGYEIDVDSINNTNCNKCYDYLKLPIIPKGYRDDTQKDKDDD